MIRMQIVERTGANLQKTLVSAMRSGQLRTFVARKRGRQVHHITYPGWMKWATVDGVIHCEILSPRKPGREWQLFTAVLGRLADRYADRINAISVQLSDDDSPPVPSQRRPRRKSGKGRKSGKSGKTRSRSRR